MGDYNESWARNSPLKSERVSIGNKSSSSSLSLSAKLSEASKSEEPMA